MKLRNPKNRFDLHIKGGQRVLEVGGGHNPHPRSNVVIDKYPGDRNLHRGLDLKVLSNQQFIEADGEELPFGDKTFDYVICNHVLEHVDHPKQFLQEQYRVAGRGYLETPSLVGEYLIPKDSHKWVLLEVDNKLILYEKSAIKFSSPHDFGFLFNEYLPKHSMSYKMLQRTQPNLLTINYEWNDNIECLVNPADQHYLNLFTKPWEKETCERVMANPSIGKDAQLSFLAFADICKSVFKSKILKRIYK